MGQKPVVNIPIPTKIQVLKWVVHLPQNGTIGFDPQPPENEDSSGEVLRS